MDPIRILKNPPLRLLLFFFVLRLVCILVLTFLATRIEFIFYLFFEMTVLTVMMLVLPLKLRLWLIPFIVMHIFQFVNLVLTGNYSLFDIYASFINGAGDFYLLLWTMLSAFEGILLWLPSIWARSYIRVGKYVMGAVIAVFIAELTLNFPIHRFVVQGVSATQYMFSDHDTNIMTPMYHDYDDLW